MRQCGFFDWLTTGSPLAHHEIPAETDAQTDEQSAARQTQGAQDAQGAQGVVVSILPLVARRNPRAVVTPKWLDMAGIKPASRIPRITGSAV